MSASTIQRLGGIALLLSTLVPATLSAQSSGQLVKLVLVPNPKDGIAPAQLAKIQAAVAAYEKRKGAAAGKDDLPFRYPFFPQAGVEGQDLFLNNFVDLDGRTNGVRDWDCSDYTYDGHHGHDSLIRSFREQAIGVPVFAVLDGVVVDTHDGEPDMNTVWDDRNLANYVLIDHGNGYIAWYFHFKKGSVAVSPGQTVTAGTQLGLTGSSGLSNWPHLHFETRRNNTYVEPSAGPCNAGDSLWEEQPPVPRDFYMADFYMTRGPIVLPNDDSFLFDEAERTGSFVKGVQTLGVRLDYRNLPADAICGLRVLNPRGQVVFDDSFDFRNDVVFHLAYAWFNLNLDLNQTGTWRIQSTVDDGVVVNTTFRVVAKEAQAKNRAPNKVSARISPPHPVTGQALACQVQTPLVPRDPDFDIVSYNYQWTVNGHAVRSVTSAALSDLLAAGTAQPRDKVKCKVVPTDGKRGGPAATAQVVEEP